MCCVTRDLFVTVMSANSVESFSEESEAEHEKEEVKEKAEVPVKKKGRGRPPRKKKPPVASVASPLSNDLKKKPTPPKSGNSVTVCFILRQVRDCSNGWFSQGSVVY